MSANIYQDRLTTRKAQENDATALLVTLNKLANNDVAVSFLGERVAFNLAKLIALHDQSGLAVADSLALAQALADKNTQLDLAHAVKAGKKADDFASGEAVPATDVVLYGFGRIGRILARLLMSRPASSNGLQLKAIVVRPAGEGDLEKRASL